MNLLVSKIILIFTLLISCTMSQTENINALKVNTLIPYGMTDKLFTGRALYFNSMKRTKGPLCACGCGKPVKWAYWDRKWNKYIKLHHQHQKGPKHSEETKKKIRESNKVTHNTPELKKKKQESWKSISRKIKMSNRLKDLWKDTEFQSKMSTIHKEIWTRPDYIKNQKTRKCSKETRRKLSEKSKKRWTDVYKKQYGETHEKENNFNWKGGISALPYPPEWNNKLKRKIKARDSSICQNPNCSNPQSTLSIHHIDYDKQNCNSNNLITLCMICNAKANGNREFHTKLYQKIVNDTINKNNEFSIP